MQKFNFLDKNIEIFKSLDGSIALYNKTLDEIYHSKFGAKLEAFEKFVEPSKILLEKNQNINLSILDICYGIGYNTKTALLNFEKISLIDCVEINENLVKNSYLFEFDEKINSIIKNNLSKEDLIHFYIQDARDFINQINADKKYNLIFHDAFSPLKQSVLWSEDFIFKLVSHLDFNGLYLTYNHSKPVLNALRKTGIQIGKIEKQGKINSVVASFDKELILHPFNQEELNSLNTRSAITYKDPNFNLTSDEIIKNRELEVKNSKLMTLSHYLKTIKSSR